ncbi:MAG: hypothetical protein LBT56_02935 [Prevotellaceae bacterium]|jgi:hypothetical protein|nr:hypothetical protein [Prevotellaceae bacterium]
MKIYQGEPVVLKFILHNDSGYEINDISEYEITVTVKYQDLVVKSWNNTDDDDGVALPLGILEDGYFQAEFSSLETASMSEGYYTVELEIKKFDKFIAKAHDIFEIVIEEEPE